MVEFYQKSRLLAGQGTCSANDLLSSSSFVYVDEVSSIATAYAMAGHATDATHVPSFGKTLELTGIKNTLAIVPQDESITLADTLAACINLGGPSLTQCSTLFGNVENGSAAPSDFSIAIIYAVGGLDAPEGLTSYHSGRKAAIPPSR